MRHVYSAGNSPDAAAFPATLYLIPLPRVVCEGRSGLWLIRRLTYDCRNTADGFVRELECSRCATVGNLSKNPHTSHHPVRPGINTIPLEPIAFLLANTV